MRSRLYLVIGALLLNSCEQLPAKSEPEVPSAPTAPAMPAASTPVATPANSYLASLQPKLVYFNGLAALPSHFTNAKATLYYFSASWCGPCKQFTPQLIEKYETLKKAGVQVVLVGRDRDKASMLQYMTDHRQPWPGLAPEDQGAFNVQQFASRGIPSMAMVDANGKLITKGIAWDTLPKALELAASGKF